ncbi:MAG: hypothetical protein ABJB03_09230 [Rhodoglobus sp.]
MPFDPALAAAQSLSTPVERLVELSQHRLIDIRIEVAKNPSTPPATLQRLSVDRSARIRLAVAHNPSLDDELVLALAEDPTPIVPLAAAWNARGRPAVIPVLARSLDASIRRIVASLNRSSQLEHDTQQLLAADENREVREQIAETTQYRDIFESLMSDPNPRVRGHCGGNPRATRDDIEQLLADRSGTTRTLTVVLGVKYPDDDQLVRVARDRTVNAQWAVVMRVGSPRVAVEIVALEGDDTNRQQAEAVLAGGGNAPQAIASVLESRAQALMVSPFI